MLGPGYSIVWHSGRSADGVGAALASRWPIQRSQEHSLYVTERTHDFPWAAVVAARIDLPDPFGPALFVHHKPSYQRGFSIERERQAVAAARFVEHLVATGPQVRHVILAGDFDDVPESASIRFWTGLQSLEGMSVCYRDAWAAVHPDDPGHTFSAGNPLVRAGDMPQEGDRRIDYIMVRAGTHGPSLQVQDCSLAVHQPVGGVQPSDHYGVVADLRLPPHEPGTWDEP